MNRVQEILQWGKKIAYIDLLIETIGLNFTVKIDRNVLPHLLGLHYIIHSSEDIRGIRLFNKVRKEKLTDEEIYEMIKENNPEQLENVKNRINYFKEFMYNLDKAKIVEMTNPKTKIKSHYLILQSLDEKYLQLGIARGKETDYLETFLVSSNDIFFKDTALNEEITGIYRYDEECNLIPFSFDPVKAEKLEREYNEQKDKENEQIDGIEIEELLSISSMDEDK